MTVPRGSAGSTASSANSTPPVFLLDDADALNSGFLSGSRTTALSGVGVGDSFDLTGSEGKHALVQRLQRSETVNLVDGAGLRLTASVVEPIPGGLRLQVTAVAQEPQPSVAITLVQALAKADRDELAISTAVEVGVDAIVPWQADRSIVIWRADKAAKAKSRWVDAVRSAAKQARRAYLPLVADVVNSKQLSALIHHTIEQGGKAWVLDAAGTVTAANAGLPNVTQNLGLLIVVGPEGGISPAELEAFQAAGAELVRLGPHIMRTSTAGPIAVSRAAERLGRWELNQAP